eukprot:CAMPEP_0174740666 /NCGR_PEP_ID=MMETSP1094-20130205/74202_1 /TAXON_ID=156173 /ORGANISM="Chrysochromulina brevifilum, Strain UTEX LB 985" /LENGTH=79 /DNA_ID=CAMNT_0015944413 /DNA_START=165 /DNA_END=401 /DNA_ORIENTATION=-
MPTHREITWPSSTSSSSSSARRSTTTASFALAFDFAFDSGLDFTSCGLASLSVRAAALRFLSSTLGLSSAAATSSCLKS